jgi:hypothetical protein
MVMRMVYIDQIKSFMINKSTQRPQIPEVVRQRKSPITLPQTPEPESVCPLKTFSRDPFGNAVFSFYGRGSIGQGHLVAPSLQGFAENDSRFRRPRPLPIAKQMQNLHGTLHVRTPPATSW